MTDQPSLPDMIAGYLPAQLLYAAAELRVPDALADGPQDQRTVAERTGTDPGAMFRLLRALTGIGLVTQLDAERFELTETGAQLRTDAPEGLRDIVRLSVMPELWRAWGGLADAVRTGSPARENGLTPFEATMLDPERSGMYRAAKASSSHEFTESLFKAYDFGRFGTIADLGDDNGALLAAILGTVPELRGVLYVDERTRADTAATLDAAGVGERCELIDGDIRTAPRQDIDVYLLNHVIRDRDDAKAQALLADCRAAMTERQRVVVVETILPEVLSPADSASYGMTDLNNLVYAGGRERTEREYRELLTGADFEVTALSNVPASTGLPDYHVIESIPRA